MNSKAANDPSRGSLAGLGKPLLEPVLAQCRVFERCDHTLDRDLGWRRIVVARTQVDDVHACLDQSALDRRDLRQRVARQTLDSLAEADHRLSGPRTGLERMPTPGISTSTTSPSCRAAVPAGVPVAIRSPGSRVMTPLRNDTSSGMEKCMSVDRARWRSTPFTRQIRSRARQSRPLATRGPAGQKVSKPFALPHWPSFC